MKTEARKENRGGVGEDGRSRSKEGVDDQCKYCQHVSQEDAAWASGGRRRAGVVPRWRSEGRTGDNTVMLRLVGALLAPGWPHTLVVRSVDH